MSENPLDNIILQSGGVGVLHDEAVFDIVDTLVIARTLKANYKLAYGRFAMRTVLAIAPMFDRDLSKLFKLSDFDEFDNILGFEMLFGINAFKAESSAIVIRDFLNDIGLGEHPDSAKITYGLSDDEYTIYSNMLHLDEYWHDCIMDRVIFVVENGGGLWSVMKELNTTSISVAFSWYRSARWLLKELG